MKRLLPLSALAASLITSTALAGSSVSVSVTPSRIFEEGGEAVFTITATPGSQGRIAVSFAMTGSALPGSDYALIGNFNGGRIIIPAGQSSTTVRLHAFSDDAHAGVETATMNILGSRSSHRSATVKILQGSL